MVFKRKSSVMDKDEDEGSYRWCFVCKDGGDPMRICDRKNCRKPYHPRCVKKEDSFLKAKGNFVCDWHICFHCGGPSKYHCYTCKNAVCRRCVPKEQFAKVKGQYGFCDECLEYAVLIERNEDFYNGMKVDFTDRDTVEGLFKEYYEIIKEEKGIKPRDVFAAEKSLKSKNERQSESGSEKNDDDEEEEEEDDDEEEEHISLKRKKKEKRYEKKAHFPANVIELEEDELDNDSEDDVDNDSEDETVGSPCKMQRKLDLLTELENPVRLSSFASIIVENIKLVYLTRYLLRKLLVQPETFEEKVIGSFVRIKSNPYDSKNPYQLVRVEGVKIFPSGENDMQVVLQVSGATTKDISIDLLTDNDISEDECKNLSQRMASGQLKRPTVGDLQQKVKILHEDITNHSIKKQLMLLDKHIERCNEKGWRSELFKYRDKRMKLQTPAEQARLLNDVPKVIPDPNEQIDCSSGEITTNGTNFDKGSPQSNSSVPKIGSQNDEAYDHKFDDLESEKWCILGPNGERDKRSLSGLKAWSEKSTYAFKFKVWREDENEKEAIWMQEALNYAFPNK